MLKNTRVEFVPAHSGPHGPLVWQILAPALSQRSMRRLLSGPISLAKATTPRISGYMNPILDATHPLIRWMSQPRSLYLPHIGSAEICWAPRECPAEPGNVDPQGRSTALGTGTSHLQTYHSFRPALQNLYPFGCRKRLFLHPDGPN
jgi:hypothetical protein